VRRGTNLWPDCLLLWDYQAGRAQEMVACHMDLALLLGGAHSLPGNRWHCVRFGV